MQGQQQLEIVKVQQLVKQYEGNDPNPQSTHHEDRPMNMSQEPQDQIV
jgi:hypothetical protein